MAEYRDHHADFRALGVGVIAVSVDDPSRSEPVRQSLGLPFLLLCDPGRELVQAWDLHNREEMGGIAYPAVFVMDRDRRVLYRSLDRTQTRVSAGGVLAFLRARAAGTPPPEPAREHVRFPGFASAARAIANMIRRGTSPSARPTGS